MSLGSSWLRQRRRGGKRGCSPRRPAAGVPEDPATGSATCAFAGTLHRYIAEYRTDGTHAVSLRQGVEMGRPSELDLSYDVFVGEIVQVRLAGAAVRVLAGQLS